MLRCLIYKNSYYGAIMMPSIKKAGFQLQNQRISEEEKEKIREVYEKGFKRGDSVLKDLPKDICRTIPLIARTAKKMGLTGSSRSLSKELSSNIAKRSNGNDNNHRGTWKAEWRTIGGKKKFFRSRWEANYARYLEFLKINNNIKDWLHEPQTFWFEKIRRGTRSYLPDFKVINLDGSHEWVEVKGWMDDRSKTKIKRFAKYYPKEKLTVVDKKWFRRNSSKVKLVCKGWE